jgi:prolyl 4-hydroxylase
MALIDKNWLKWIKENLDNGCNKNDLFKILLENNFNYKDIYYSLEFENNINLEVNKLTTNKIQTKLNEFKIPNENLEIYSISNFLTEEECDELLISINNENFIKSKITNKNEPDKNFRTSTTANLFTTNPIYEKLNNKICNYLGIQKEKGETIQAQKYYLGQEFKLHNDYFSRTDECNKEHLLKGGQRTYTFMIYLNNVKEGGCTQFPLANLTLQPIKCTAIIWNNLDKDNNDNIYSKHCGMPIIDGEKIIITKWFRETKLLN